MSVSSRILCATATFDSCYRTFKFRAILAGIEPISTQGNEYICRIGGESVRFIFKGQHYNTVNLLGVGRITMVQDLSGKTIKGYELQKLIGAGGFGAVYKAFQPAVKREVAVKIILPEYVNHPEFVRRFEAEAQLVAHLEHIHIVPLYDFWRDQTGAYLVMRWLRGGSLRHALEKGHWPLEDAPRLVDQIASALTVAHRNGVIHRDLKPDNILLDEEKNAYLADFGIAKDLENITDFAALLAADEEGFMGSPAYLAPEQIKTEPVSPQTDIYSMGIMLFEILTGRTPFHGLPVSTLIFKHLQEPLPHLNDVRPDLPAELNEVIVKATDKDATKRHPSILALAADFRKALLSSEAAIEGLGLSALDTSELSRLGITEEYSVYAPEGIAPENPYKGLRAFQEADADDFRGREVLVDRLLEHLKGDTLTSRFLSVIGPSGSGKSSVVKAGIIPKLRRGAVVGSSDWYIVEMMPGSHPLEELEAALLRVAINPPATLLDQLKEDERGLVRAIKRVLPSGTSVGSELVLVVDQFEEVFTQVEDESERSHFLNSLLAATQEKDSRLRIITTLRADFYDRPLLYPEFGELIRQSTEVVLPLNREELERAIVEPAENAGLALEVGLVTEIIADVGEQPGALPLLQYALTELFERRDGRWLTVQAYKEIGGVSGALARRASELYETLDETGQRAARQMFLRLVTLGEGSEDTRRRVLMSELLSLQGDEQAMQSVIDLFGKYRLLTFDRDPVTRSPTLEVAHEALIRTWQMLRKWLDDNREDLRLQRRLSAATEEWLNSGQDPSYLATGTRLEQFEAWLPQTELALTEAEREYYSASLAQREKMRAEEAARKAHEAALERRSRNFLRALVAVMALATVGALILTGFALNQSQIAQENAATATVAQGDALFQAATATFAQGDALVQADRAATAAAVAELNAEEARSLAFASGSQLALSNNNTDLAIILALAANNIPNPSIEAQRTLAEAAYAPGTRRVFTGHTDRLETTAFSPDGKTALSGSNDFTMKWWDISSGEMLGSFEGHTGWVWDVAFTPDGTQAISASQDTTLILWDLESGEVVHKFEGHTTEVQSVAISPNGETALSGSHDTSLILWDLESGEMIRKFAENGGGHSAQVYTVEFSPSGFTALSGSEDRSVILWNVQSGEPIMRFSDGITSAVWSVAYRPDELGMVTGMHDGTLLLWSFETGAPIRSFVGHTDRVTGVAFSPDGRALVSSSQDGSVILWDVETGALIRRYVGHTDRVYGVDYSPDGLYILSAGWDRTLRLWDIENGAQLQLFKGHSGDVNDVAFSPDGKLAASASADSSIILWDTTTGVEIRKLEGHTDSVNSLVFTSDGKSLLSGSADRDMILWDVQTGEVILKFEAVHGDTIYAVDLSPDGKLAVSGSRDNTVVLWDVETGTPIKRGFGHTFHVLSVAFSPDGKTFASAGRDNMVILWDADPEQRSANLTEIRRFEGHTDWVFGVTFSPDSKLLLSGGGDNSLILWDAASGTRLRRYEGHSSFIYSMSFTPDGRFALSGAADTTMILWNIETGDEVRRFTGHTDDVRSLAISADGRTILSGSGDDTMREWQLTLDLGELREWLNANRYVRDLTCAERDRFDVPPLCPTPTPVIIPGSV
jgi:WD40 repeat protein/serine/threonine protein kinase